MGKYLLITGLIAQHALARVTEKITGISLEIKPLACTVAALMTTDFIARELARQGGPWDKDETIVIPGLCQGSLQPICEATGCKVLRGPNDLIDLPSFFDAGKNESPVDISGSGLPPMNILGEIVNAPRMSEKEIIEKASYFRDSGADFIDIGGDLNQPFPHLKRVIKALRKEGFKVSVDSHQNEDILAGSQAGAELILSLTSRNLEIAKSLDCEVVVIPDDGENLESLYRNIEKLEQWKVPYIVDPILPPPAMGLITGLGRYLQVRKDFPDCKMLMGLGNVTELIDADSIGINALLTGIASELKVNYILTTEVSHRATGTIKEVALARRLFQKAISEGRLPKYIDDSLLAVKDPAGNSFGEEELREMHRVIRDKNYRIFVYDQIYVFNAHVFIKGTSAQEVFSKLDIRDAGHAFYLGRELEKAETALRLGKKYVQDNPLRWGYFNKKL